MLHTTKTITMLALLTPMSLGSSPAAAQEMAAPPPVAKPQREARMQSILHQAERLNRDLANQPLVERQKALSDRHIDLRGDGLVHVEIVGPAGVNPVPAALITQIGGQIDGTWKHRTDAWVPIDRLSTLARAMPPEYYMTRAELSGDDAVGGEGAVSINSDSYRDNGSNGAGKIIAVIDGGYANFTASQNAGDAPPNASITFKNYTGSGFQAGTSSHGTACTECAFDHCPGATWRLYKVDSLTDLGTAVDDCIANGVDVISHSLSKYNLGWADNSGDACAAANDAANNGILFFTSAGNRAGEHWQGDFNGGGNDWHNFSGADETIDITVANNDASDYYLSWDTTGGVYDYDFYLYNSADNTVLAFSNNWDNEYESFTYTNNSGASQNLKLRVYRYSGGVTEMEIFVHQNLGITFNQYAIAAGSTTSPSNATNSNVICNGAVAVASHTQPNGAANIIQGFSSQGPSNSGMTLPDLAGPDNTTTTASGGFTGTSGSTPNNAGAACAFWSEYSGFNSFAIRWLMYEQADLWKDWGAAGNDNIYGRGGTILTDWVNRTVWLARNYNNAANAATGPYFTAQAAYNAALNGGRIYIFPGGSYPETVSMNGTKALLVQTAQNTATLGN